MKLKKSLYLKMRLLWTIFKRLGLWSGSARSQLAMWCRVESEPQTFLWCDANSAFASLTSKAYDVLAWRERLAQHSPKSCPHPRGGDYAGCIYQRMEILGFPLSHTPILQMGKNSEWLHFQPGVTKPVITTISLAGCVTQMHLWAVLMSSRKRRGWQGVQ